MKINRVHLMSDREIKEKINDIDYCIQRISVNDTFTAMWTLSRIKDDMNEKLKESKL